ncbi:MAG: hypothetical protein GWN81_11460 [Phycisphaerae bacterium]|nr:hypothetical protein [Phycisphaerae bacterium]
MMIRILIFLLSLTGLIAFAAQAQTSDETAVAAGSQMGQAHGGADENDAEDDEYEDEEDEEPDCD